MTGAGQILKTGDEAVYWHTAADFMGNAVTIDINRLSRHTAQENQESRSGIFAHDDECMAMTLDVFNKPTPNL
jgi:hypothetical protein